MNADCLLRYRHTVCVQNLELVWKLLFGLKKCLFAPNEFKFYSNNAAIPIKLKPIRNKNLLFLSPKIIPKQALNFARNPPAAQRTGFSV